MERTMQFIVETLADVAVQQQEAAVRAKKAEQRMDRFEQRMDRADQRMDKLERQMKGIQTLVKTGMRMMVDIQKAQKRLSDSIDRLAVRMDELADAQKKTDRYFKSWLESMRGNGRRGSNGHSKKPN